MSNKYFTVSILPFAAFSYANTSASSDHEQISQDSMVITASRFEQPVSTVLAPVSILTRSDLKELQAKTLVDALKVLPGIEIGQNGGLGQSASIFLRGTESNHVLVLLDGVRLPRTMLGTIDFNILPLNSVERIEVIRGSGATIYGSDAIGGVINIITRTDIESKRFELGGGSFGSFSTSGGITTQLTDALAMQIQGGYEKADGYNVHPDYALPGSEHGFKNKNASLRLSYAPVENWRSNLIGRWYQSDTEYDSFGSKQNSWVDSFSVGVDSVYRLAQWNHIIRAEFGEQKNYDYLSSTERTSNNLTSKISQIYASAASRYQLEKTIALTAGADITLEEYLAGNFISASDIVDNPRRNIGVFALVNWDLSDSLLVEASARHDQNQQYGGNNTYLLALGWTISPQYRLFTSYGSAFKAPGFDSLYGYGGNINLKPEMAENIEIGLEGSDFGISWAINGYINKINNLIDYDHTIPLAINIDKAEIKGIELSADFETGLFYNQISVDFRDPIDKTRNEQLARRAKRVAKWRTSVWIKDVQLGVQYLYQSERPDFSGGEILPSYSLWDVTAQYNFSDQISLSGKIANALNKKYETAGGYPAPERAFYVNIDFSY